MENEFELLKHNTYRVLALLLDTQSKYSFMTNGYIRFPTSTHIRKYLMVACNVAFCHHLGTFHLPKLSRLV